MDAEQRAPYDAHGYLHLRGVLEPDHLQRLNAVYDERLQAEILSGSESSERGGGWAPRRRANFDTQSQRYTHLRQVLEHPAHAVMEQTRDKMREALHAGEEGWKRAGLEPDMTARRRAPL